MFTGIVEAVGCIERVIPGQAGARLAIDAGRLDLGDVKPGDSIAVNGVCLTVTAITGRLFTVDVSAETLSCTEGLDRAGAEVNLERALRLADRLGGHLVSGHVDGAGEVTAFEPAGECWRLAVRAPQPLARYLAPKGSVTVDGVSLTVNRVDGAEFEVNLIPHTLDATSLRRLAPGARVNLEADMVARYVERLLADRG
ncbi:MAG TPA: riboflavin synthase [Burkholderiales bacterium]